MTLVIRTNHAWRQFLYRDEVPAKILEHQFDYPGPEESINSFVKYHGIYYHLGQFIRIDPESESFPGWHGICHESWSSGVVIRMSADGETYQIASYYVKGYQMTIHDIKYRHEQAGGHFFSRENMRAMGDTMRNFGCSSKPVEITHHDGTTSLAYRVWRKNPVRPIGAGPYSGGTYYFDATTFRQTFSRHD
jgi:hypothetical protein